MSKQSDKKTGSKNPKRIVVRRNWPGASKQPFFNRWSTVGLFVILLQLVVVFIMLPHYNKTTPFSTVISLAATEPGIDGYVDPQLADATSAATTTTEAAIEPTLPTDSTSDSLFTANAAVSTITHDAVSEDADYNHINQLRNNNGKADYIRSACLTGIAQAWAKAYAAYGVRVHNIHLRDQIKADCTTQVDAVAENMMAQDTECHSWLVMTTITVPLTTPCGTRTAVASVACGDRSNILDTRVPNNSACTAYPTGYPYHFKYVGVGAYKAPNGLTYIVQDFAGCDSTCRNLPATLASGASTFPNQLRLGESLSRGEKISSGAGDSW